MQSAPPPLYCVITTICNFLNKSVPFAPVPQPKAIRTNSITGEIICTTKYVENLKFDSHNWLSLWHIISLLQAKTETEDDGGCVKHQATLQTTILGEKIAFPVCIAPTGMQLLAHPIGKIRAARGHKLSVCRWLKGKPFLRPHTETYLNNDRWNGVMAFVWTNWGERFELFSLKHLS